VSEEAKWRSGSGEFQTDGTAIEKARGAKWEETAGFEKRMADGISRITTSHQHDQQAIITYLHQHTT